MNPKISVIIPVYNGMAYLAKAIESVLAQSYPAYEIIVVDDGSTDDSKKILDLFNDRIVRIRTPNSGISRARSTGLRLVRGNYVAFIDHDDVWFRNKLEKHAEAILKYPEIGFFCSNFAVRHGFLNFRMVKHFSILKNKHSLNYDEPLQDDPCKLLLHEHFVGVPSTVVMKKKLVDEVGDFNPKYLCTQDYDYWLRCALRTNFVVLSDVLVYKRSHPDNFSNDLVRMYSEHRTLLMDTYKAQTNYIRTHRLEGVYNQAMADINYLLGDVYFKEGQRKRAYQLYYEAFQSRVTLKNSLNFLSKISRKSAKTVIAALPIRRPLLPIGS